MVPLAIGAFVGIEQVKFVGRKVEFSPLDIVKDIPGSLRGRELHFSQAHLADVNQKRGGYERLGLHGRSVSLNLSGFKMEWKPGYQKRA